MGSIRCRIHTRMLALSRPSRFIFFELLGQGSPGKSVNPRRPLRQVSTSPVSVDRCGSLAVACRTYDQQIVGDIVDHRKVKAMLAALAVATDRIDAEGAALTGVHVIFTYKFT